MTFRKIIFWVHLVAGLLSGLAIGVMCFTGTILAFEKEIIAWSERDARRIEPPSENAARLPLEELQRRFRGAQPEMRTANMVIQNDPRAAVAFGAGRTGAFYVNPYTGEIRQPRSSEVSQLMQKVTAWHRYLGFTGEVSRPRGKWINGVCNIAFCALAITGLYLWMPRSWSWRAVKPAIWFRQNSSSKARDFNWHNTIGFWSAPILIVLTLTAVPISFQWGGRVINSLTNTPQPAAGAPAGPGGTAALPAVVVPTPDPTAQPLSQDALVAAVQKAIPSWKTITVGGAAGRGGPGGTAGRGGAGATGERGGRGGGTPQSEMSPITNSRGPTGTAVDAALANTAAIAPAATFTVRARDSWPRTVNTTLTLNPYTGEVLRRTGYAEQAPAQQVRSWTRFLHTGEALGFWGQLVAGLACLGGCFLVYTGIALSWRRFFGKKAPAMPDAI